MNELWTNIKEKKYDLTKYGNWAGTGVVVLSNDVDFIFL
jgi:hypothetical protein